ncbi:MAG TPA: pyridoxal-dependent decarboxylase [Gammaproteobacteria bacterium]|nr:pyridoxal-dependent decarboxylase [Gammaproteobacteria bacterium]
MPTKLDRRHAPLNLSAAEFRELGHALVDRIAAFYESLPTRPITRGLGPKDIRALIGDTALPETGTDPAALLAEFAPLHFDNSLHNGHPRFMGYITSSAAPLGALGDLLAAAVNSNVGAWDLSPVATEIERQTIRWIAELVGYPSGCGGILVSGGNMANFLGFYAARRAKAPWDIRETGLYGDPRRLTVYASDATHTWLQKAADLSGIGIDNVRWIASDHRQCMRLDELEARIAADRNAGHLPFLVVGAAGTVSTGTVDRLPAIAAICKRESLWFHVDGAYGAPAASLPEADAELKGLGLADSVALDPHKWLYSPIEAGCTLVRAPEHLTDAFSFRPAYYKFEGEEEDPRINFYEYGMQNTRGFRALKVWLALRTIGREGYVRMIRDDIALARRLHAHAIAHPELEAFTCELSIVTFRYRPRALEGSPAAVEAYLDELNDELLTRLQGGGEAYVSNAVLEGRKLLRACIVNFRTTADDIDAIPEIVVRLGREVDREQRPAATLG